MSVREKRISSLPKRMRAIVTILFAHELELSDGYGYYTPGRVLDEVPEKFRGDAILTHLVTIAEEIEAAMESDDPPHH
jgi:hypothetical protein